MSFLHSFDSRMRRVVQENPSLNRSYTNRTKQKGTRCCLFMIMMIPLLLVLLIMFVLSIYNDMVRYEQQIGPLLRAAEMEEKQKLEQQQQQQQPPPNINSMSLRTKQQQQQQQEVPKQETLVLETKYGDIRILLRPDLSPESIDYIHRLVESGVCRRCNLYRAEKPGILQGVMANKEIPTNSIKGKCPEEAKNVPVGECPSWDKECSCHGPLMTRGSVAWAAGSAGGPDFFIDNYKRPADWWGTQHTNFGTIQQDDETNRSFAIIEQIFEQPSTNRGGMHVLNDVVSFRMKLE